MTAAVAEAGVAVRSSPGGSVAACTTSGRGACAWVATGATASATSAARTATSAKVRRMREPSRLWREFRLLLLEELDGPAQPLVEIHERPVAHQPRGLADVGERVRHVAGAAGRVAALQRAAEQILEAIDD